MMQLQSELPLSPAPSPVPSIRRLHIHSSTPANHAVDNGEGEIIKTFQELDVAAQGRVLRKLLETAPREALLDAQSVISPRLRHDPFKVLPLEISLGILSYIRDPKSLAAAAQVSRLWYFLLSDDFTWKQMCRDHHFRRLSAAGSYVHQWNEHRERAPSEAIEETPEAEGESADDDRAGLRHFSIAQMRSNSDARVSARRNSLLNHISSVTSQNLQQLFNQSQTRSRQWSRQESQQDPHHVQLQEQASEQELGGEQSREPSEEQPNGNENRPNEESRPNEDENRLSGGAQTEIQNLSSRARPRNRGEAGYSSGIQSEAVSPSARTSEDVGPVSNDLYYQYAVANNNADYPSMPLIHYGSRLPNFDPEMQRHLSASADPSDDPIGEAYYDPEACVTSPPDSYRSHFRQQYLLNQAWTDCGILAARYSLPNHETAIVTTVLMKDGYIVVALDTSLILVFSDDGKLLRSLYGHVMGVWALALSGHTLMSGGCDRDVREWDLKTGACRKILRGHSSTVRCLAMVSPHIALSGGRDGVIRVWDLKNGRSLHRLTGHAASVRRLEVTQLDGRYLAVSASYDCTAKIWDIEKGELLHTLAGHSNQIYSLAVDKDRIATGSLDHTIRIWDIRTGANLGVLTGHAALVGQLAINGNTVVSGGSDGSVRIWDMDKMTCLYRIAAHDHTVTCLRVTEDRIITGGPDCKVQVWDARTGEHLRQLQKPTVSTVWGVAAQNDRLLTVYSEGASVVIELVSFVPK